MPRVKCPHCGAGNQDATEQDTCWQCSNVLGAPVMRTETVSPSPGVIPSEPTQQLNIEMLKKMPLPPVQQQTQRSSPSPLVLTLVALLVMALVVILALMMRH